MRGGHYAAYIKVRPPQKKSDQHHRNLSGKEDVEVCHLYVAAPLVANTPLAIYTDITLKLYQPLASYKMLKVL